MTWTQGVWMVATAWLIGAAMLGLLALAVHRRKMGFRHETARPSVVGDRDRFEDVAAAEKAYHGLPRPRRKGQAMSIQAMTRVMESSEAEATDRLVLLVMANRAGGDNDECFASVDRIAYECRLAPRTIQYAIGRLTKSGDLAHQGIHPTYRTNIYRVSPRVQEMHPPARETPSDAPELKELGSELGSEVSSSLVTHLLDDSIDETSDAYKLCARLAVLIEENGSKRPTITKDWVRNARLLLEKDGRTFIEAMTLIEWCQHDQFWFANILSMPTFRKQYDRLRMKSQGRASDQRDPSRDLPPAAEVLARMGEPS